MGELDMTIARLREYVSRDERRNSQERTDEQHADGDENDGGSQQGGLGAIGTGFLRGHASRCRRRSIYRYRRSPSTRRPAGSDAVPA